MTLLEHNTKNRVENDHTNEYAEQDIGKGRKFVKKRGLPNVTGQEASERNAKTLDFGRT